MNYRYTLHREWLGKGGFVNFIMLNPSTADETCDDATIRRCVGFAKRWRFSGISVTNLFAYRATRPKVLMELVRRDANLAIGEDNDAHIIQEASECRTIVCAWGDNCEILPSRSSDVIEQLRTLRGYELFCIRETSKGNPAHPLREKYTDDPLLMRRRS